MGDSTTHQPAITESGGERQFIPTLTVASHPDLARIGERARLIELSARRPADLSRTALDFAPPTKIWQGRPLADRYLSRSPIRFQQSAQGAIDIVSLGSTVLSVDGQPAIEVVRIEPQRLDQGVVLELAHRIVLLLHRLPEDWRSTPAHGPRNLVGWSPTLQRVHEAIERVGDLDVAVLLRGESGTGKELVARALHNARQDAGTTSRPFIAVNLGALPPQLAASELFGNVKGAFTGAVSARQGYFRAAEGGTLFLDEVGEAPPEVQVLLLRALETGDIYPVGSQRPVPINVRLIAATDSDLEARAHRGEFKAPLLHRLAAYEIRLPSLRQRREDIGRLALHFALQEMRSLGQPDPLDEFREEMAEPWLPAALVGKLLAYPWPGNVRELKNVVRQLVIDSRGASALSDEPRLDSTFAASACASADSQADSPVDTDPVVTTGRRPADITFDELAEVLGQNRWEPAAAARQLGISRGSVYTLIRRHPHLRVAEDIDDQTIAEQLDASAGDVAHAAQTLRVSSRALSRRLKRIERNP